MGLINDDVQSTRRRTLQVLRVLVVNIEVFRDEQRQDFLDLILALLQRNDVQQVRRRRDIHDFQHFAKG